MGHTIKGTLRRATHRRFFSTSLQPPFAGGSYEDRILRNLELHVAGIMSELPHRESFKTSSHAYNQVRVYNVECGVFGDGAHHSLPENDSENTLLLVGKGDVKHSTTGVTVLCYTHDLTCWRIRENLWKVPAESEFTVTADVRAFQARNQSGASTPTLNNRDEETTPLRSHFVRE